MDQLRHTRYDARLEFAGGKLVAGTPAKVLVNYTLGLVWIVIGRFVVEATVNDPDHITDFAIAAAGTLIERGHPVRLTRWDCIKRIRPHATWQAPQTGPQLVN